MLVRLFSRKEDKHACDFFIRNRSMAFPAGYLRPKSNLFANVVQNSVFALFVSVVLLFGNALIERQDFKRSSFSTSFLGLEYFSLDSLMTSCL